MLHSADEQALGALGIGGGGRFGIDRTSYIKRLARNTASWKPDKIQIRLDKMARGRWFLSGRRGGLRKAITPDEFQLFLRALGRLRPCIKHNGKVLNKTECAKKKGIDTPVLTTATTGAPGVLLSVNYAMPAVASLPSDLGGMGAALEAAAKNVRALADKYKAHGPEHIRGRLLAAVLKICGGVATSGAKLSPSAAAPLRAALLYALGTTITRTIDDPGKLVVSCGGAAASVAGFGDYIPGAGYTEVFDASADEILDVRGTLIRQYERQGVNSGGVGARLPLVPQGPQLPVVAPPPAGRLTASALLPPGTAPMSYNAQLRRFLGTTAGSTPAPTGVRLVPGVRSAHIPNGMYGAPDGFSSLNGFGGFGETVPPAPPPPPGAMSTPAAPSTTMGEQLFAAMKSDVVERQAGVAGMEMIKAVLGMILARAGSGVSAVNTFMNKLAAEIQPVSSQRSALIAGWRAAATTPAPICSAGFTVTPL
jgi:hypothetical protein